MRLIAIRHGETEWNTHSREQGQLDSPLTPRGVAQAQAIANRLRDYRFDALYSSDLGRALATTRAISLATGKQYELDAGLRERHMGIFQGLNRAEMADRFPDEYGAYRSIGHTYQVPEGESGEQRLERSVRVMLAIADRHPDETVVVVTHGGFLMGFFEHVLGLLPGSGWRFKRQNASYSAFEYRDRRWCLETWNDTSHLQELTSLDD